MRLRISRRLPRLGISAIAFRVRLARVERICRSQGVSIGSQFAWDAKGLPAFCSCCLDASASKRNGLAKEIDARKGNMVTIQTPTAPAVTPTASQSVNPPANNGAVNDLQTLSFGQLMERKPGFSILKTLGLAKLTALVAEAFKSEASYKDAIEANREAMGVQYKPAGKVLAAMQTSYEEDLANADIRQGLTFAAYYEEKMDRKLDAGRASQCARVFRKLVVPGHLPENDYDNVAVDWLEKASKIIDLVVKAGKDMTSDMMLDVINVLKVRPDSGAKRLRQIKNKLEGKETVSPDGKGPELNAPAFVALLKRGLSMNFPIGGHGLLLAMTEIIGLANTAKDLPADVAKQFYHSVAQVQDSLIGAVGDSTIADWEKQLKAATAKPELAPMPDFIAWLKSAYVNMTDDEAKEGADDLLVFYEDKKRLPANAEEFDVWMEVTPNPAKVAA
jgi:hypothetical protein